MSRTSGYSFSPLSPAAYVALAGSNAPTMADPAAAPFLSVTQRDTSGGQKYAFEVHQYGLTSGWAGHHYGNGGYHTQFDNTTHNPLHKVRHTENAVNNYGSKSTGPIWQIDTFAPVTFTDGATTNTSPTFTSATAAFVAPTPGVSNGDQGAAISGPGIPDGTYILAVVNSTTVTLSQNATATATGVKFSLSGRGGAQIAADMFDAFLVSKSYYAALPITYSQAPGLGNGTSLRVLLPSTSNGDGLLLDVRSAGNGLRVTDGTTDLLTMVKTATGTKWTGPSSNASLTLDNTTGAQLKYSTATITLASSTVTVGASGNTLGFFGGSGGTKQTVSGSRSANAALASLLTALAAYGIVTDSSTA